MRTPSPPCLLRLLMLSISLLVLSGSHLHAQFNTAIQDGVINPGEYGSHVNGQNQESNSGTTYFMSWDANNLYVAFINSNFSEAAVIYLDYNPVLPINGGTDANGSLQGFFTYDRNHMLQPFRADFALYYKNSYHEYRHADGAGYWGGQTANTLPTGTNGGSNTVEIAIPWNVLTQGGGRPASFNWFTYKVYDYGPGTNGVYSAIPAGNPACACNQDPSRLYATHYYNVLNTNNAAATRPFSQQSFTYSEDNSTPGTGGYYLNGGTFYDLTVNDNSTDNLDNDIGNRVYDNNGPANRVLADGSITLTHDLYIGRGSALLPADNSGGNVLATITFSPPLSGAGSIYNFGRIDPNPEAFTLADINARRLDMRFLGPVVIEATDVFKDLWRMSNVFIGLDGELVAPGTDAVEIELQWGTMDNIGTVNGWDGGPGVLNFATRGDWTVQNDYFFGNSTGDGGWQLYSLLIGRNSSRLAPVANGGVSEVEIHKHFENYDEFLGKNGTGRIDIDMTGETRQEIRGNINETSGGATTFHNLRIANAGFGTNNNDSADVHFVSFGGGNIDYFVTGNLELAFGDLVTRDRANAANAHNLTLRDSASIDFSGASSNPGTFGSCFIDGPLRWEVEAASPVVREFPVGKSLDIGGYQIGDYRHARLDLDHDVVTKTVYTAEMFLQDQSAAYIWPGPVPEMIDWISKQRYWRISKGAGANVQSAQVTLAYDLDERNDGVTNPPALRIVKDDGAGNWVNITPLGPGGTGVGSGTIQSAPFTAFSDFTLASVDENMPLPVEILAFDARWREGAVRLDWTTALEVNSDHFVVERSLDQATFSEVAAVAATGNSAVPVAYEAWDRNWPEGSELLYYRLKSVDREGFAQYSEVRTVKRGAAASLEVYPNPATDQVHLRTGGAPITSISLRNALGQQVLYLRPAAPQAQLEVGALAPGVYLMQAVVGTQVVTEKLLIEQH